MQTLTKWIAAVTVALTIALVLLICVPGAVAQASHSHGNAAQQQLQPAQGELLRIVRQSRGGCRRGGLQIDVRLRVRAGCGRHGTSLREDAIRAKPADDSDRGYRPDPS